MLKRLHQLGESRADFAFESTLSSRSFVLFLKQLKKQGYSVAIYYFSLANAQLAVRRVKMRVAMGGHNVPTDVVKRRFLRSLSNFFTLYAPLADEWTMFDNSVPPQARQIAAHSANKLIVIENITWHKLQKLSQVA